MRLTVLGCSGSVVGPDSPASGYLLQAPDSPPLVIDFGGGVLGALQRHVDPGSVHVLLSHLHADHTHVPSLLLLDGEIPIVVPRGAVDAFSGLRRFGDRLNELGAGDETVIGSVTVRAVPAEAMPAIADWATGRPIHVHVSEQVAENRDCVAAYVRTPTELLADHDVLGPLTTAVHATHLTEDDIAHLARTRTYAGFCPTTERDLGDGVGPSTRLRDAGVRLTLGSDSHAVIDPFEEMRALETDERLITQERGHWSAAELLEAGTVDGHASLGWDDAGAIAVGQRADLVTVDTTSPRTAGTGADAHTAVFAATAADVTQVMVDGRVVVRQGDRDELGRELDEAIGRVWR